MLGGVLCILSCMWVGTVFEGLFTRLRKKECNIIRVYLYMYVCLFLWHALEPNGLYVSASKFNVSAINRLVLVERVTPGT